MRLFCAALFICWWALPDLPAAGPVSLSADQQRFHDELAAKSRLAEKENAGAVAGVENWLFLASDIRFLGLGQFWGDEASKVSRARKADAADPIPAIVDFNKQLQSRGIELLILPVPPKAAIYPEKIIPDVDLKGQAVSPFLGNFYGELRSRGVNVIDLTSVFQQNRANERGPVFCRTDSHWSGIGCALAAQAVAGQIKGKFGGQPRNSYTAEWKEAELNGDLVDLLGTKSQKPGPEKISVRAVSDQTGAGLNPDPNSPLLIMGDSHTLVFHDFHAERAGLLDELAQELGFLPDMIGTRGSGATAVRITLYRRSLKDPEYLAKKKMIVWCFAAREFTESDQGWEKVPISK